MQAYTSNNIIIGQVVYQHTSRPECLQLYYFTKSDDIDTHHCQTTAFASLGGRGGGQAF